MKNRGFISISNNYIFTFFLGFFLLGISCSNNDKIPIPDPTYSIMELLSSETFKESATVKDDIALDSLEKYLRLEPALVTLLEGSGAHTLFAPSNKAFKDFKSDNVLLVELPYMNTMLVNSIFQYHIVAGKKLQADLKEEELSSLYTDPSSPDAPQKISINSDATLKPGLSRPSAKINRADNQAFNGMIHVIDKILMPPSIEQKFTGLRGTMASYIVISKQFSILYKLIQFADQGFTEVPTEYKFKIATWLAMPVTNPANATGITFLALSNGVINSYAGGESTFLNRYDTPDLARNFLLNHMIKGQYSVGDIQGATKITDGLILTTLGGGTLTVNSKTPTASNPGVFTISTGERKMIDLKESTSNVLNDFLENGILHFALGAGLDPD